MKKRGMDVLLVAALVLAGVGMAVLLWPREPGEAVQVRVDGTVTAEYPLSASLRTRIEGVGGYNELVIEDGSARLEEADCPDRICVRTGRIRQKGQSIICLPHKVVIEIVGAAPSPAPDVTGR